MQALKDLKILSDELRLSFETQDWGIINSDGKRLREFIGFGSTRELKPTQQWELVELVLASANEAMSEGVFGDAEADALAVFLAGGWYGLPEQIRYWSSLDDLEEFPVARLLRDLAIPA